MDIERSFSPRHSSGIDFKTFVGHDLMASVVVFLVALPLCMGVAIASGAPPALGLASGIIGGIVVGALAGQPLQVSGPAAGLAVLVWRIIEDFGLAGLGLAALVCGVIQIAAGVAGLGRWFRAVAPAVIQGMLGGIGVLIFASQFHVMLDDKPVSGGLQNLLSIPEAIYKGIFPMDGSVHHKAAAIGLLTIALIVGWNRFRPKALHVLPGPLIGAVGATLTALLFPLPIARVEVPDNLLASLNWISVDSPLTPRLTRVLGERRRPCDHREWRNIAMRDGSRPTSRRPAHEVQSRALGAGYRKRALRDGRSSSAYRSHCS